MNTSEKELMQHPEALPPEKKKIIVADDDAGIIDAVSIMLNMAGYNVQTTLNGGALVAMLKEFSPDLILLDIWMSGEDGKEVCRELKANPETQHIPVILFSASKEIEQSALAAGADGFLAKPFEMHDLLGKIGGLVSK